ncbi:copper resistance CopC family protein [Micromonospora sp. Llam0]|uniref:copper resistance CopC family protein n=1 Tax=Micromonospora sp. Llam0 TaxID=2485143 RepID=UPI00131569AC|nr:copper resistance CopC family protein [Micromonospora sp. Llam0]
MPAATDGAAGNRTPAGVVTLAAVVAVMLLATPGSARADQGGRLLQADPPVGAALSVAPTGVTLSFTDTVQPELSHVEVFDGAGEEVTDGDYRQVAPDRVHQPVRTGVDGDYTVAYHVTFPDGSDVTDVYRFSVGTGAPPAALDAATREARTDAVSDHAHEIDGFSATLLVIDGLVLFVVIAMLWLRPRDGRPMSLRYRDDGSTPSDRRPDGPSSSPPTD